MLTTRQQQCLKGIGIDRWTEPASTNGIRPEAGSDPADSNTAYLQKSDIVGVPDRGEASPTIEVTQEKGDLSPDPEIQTIETSLPPELDSWDSIIGAIHGCDACALAQNCTQKVPGCGDRQADLMIIGEGPGHDEDIRGEPFVGRSGQLLERMLAAIGFARKQVYITNIVKCRPPNNRDPKQTEALQCRAYLEAQIKQIAPKIILSVGRVSAQNLLGSTQPVGKLIKQMHQLPDTGIPVKVTYHPAYLLRNPSAKAIAWQDLKLLHQMLQ